METRQLTALLQLSSPALPIGGYSYSQGFEAAVDLKIVGDEASAHQWIQQQLELVIAQCDAPIWALLFDGWASASRDEITYWNSWYHASRETLEIRRETEQMGWSLAKLATDMNWGTGSAQEYLLAQPIITLPAAHAYAVHALGIGKGAGLAAYLFSWLENQVMAAIKTVPLGQMAGQRILNAVRQSIPTVHDDALSRAAQTPPRVYTLAPQLAMLSSRHETQYSRLFRS